MGRLSFTKMLFLLVLTPYTLVQKEQAHGYHEATMMCSYTHKKTDRVLLKGRSRNGVRMGGSRH